MSNHRSSSPLLTAIRKGLNRIVLLSGFAWSLLSPSHVFAQPVAAQATNASPDQQCPATLDFTLRELDGDKHINLCETYKGKVVLIVNTASKCGFTPQFEALEALHEMYKDRGFSVLGFPSNDFGAQDPGSEKEIATFCRMTYGVKFPMFEKTHAAKKHADPLYQTLGNLAGEYPRWNFHKYVLNTRGELLGSFSSIVKPTDKKLITLIEANLP
ncbi:MAG: glutathione peroxidase [bacterium]